MPSLADLSLGLRNAYLDHSRLTAQLQAWSGTFPSLCRLSSIAKTPEGRDLWLLTIGPDPERLRPGPRDARARPRRRARRVARVSRPARRAHDRRRRPVLQALPRGPHRALRRQARAVAILPRR